MRTPLARCLLATLALLALGLPAGADIGNTPLQAWHFSSGDIVSMKRSGRVLYVAGGFDAIAAAANVVGSVAVLDAAGAPTWPGPVVEGRGSAVAEDGGGGFYLGRVTGSALAGNVTYRLDHLRADGTIDPGFQPVLNGAVATLTRLGTTLYVGGFFTTVNGQVRGLGAAFDIPSGALLPWDPRIGNGALLAIADGGLGRVYIGGDFNKVAGATAIGLVRVSATTGGIDTVVNTSVSANGAVTALLTVGTTLYVGGRFTTIENIPRTHVAALDLIQQNVTALAANVGGGTVSAMAVSGSRLFIGGTFTDVNTVPRTGIAGLDATTGALLPWRVKLNGVASALTVVGNTLYLGGPFTTVNGERRAHAAAVDAAGASAQLLPWNPGLTEPPAALRAASAGQILAVGPDFAVGARVRDGLAAFDLATHELLPFAPALDVPFVVALDVTPSTIYFGGRFTTVNGAARSALAAVDPDGRLLPWAPGSPTTVPEVVLASGSTVYVGGLFTVLGGQPRMNLGAVDAVTGAATPVRFDTNSDVGLLQVVGTTLYAGGSFTTAGGQPREDVAAFDTTSGAVLPLRLMFDNHSLTDIRVVGSLLYVGGSFTALGGQPRTHAAAVDRVTGAVAPFAPTLNGLVFKLVERAGTVFLVGRFSTINGVPRAGQGAVASGLGNVTLPFNPSLGTTVFWDALDAGPNGLFGAASRPATQLCLWPDSPPGGEPAPPSALRVRVNGSALSVSWNRGPLAAAPSSYLLEAAASPGGPALGTVAVGPAASFSVSGVPPGLYFLRVRAVAAGGLGAASPEVGVAVGQPGCVVPPAPPVLTALAGGGSVALQWDSVPSASATYSLMAGTAPGTSNLGTAAMGAATAFSGAAPPGVYYARVQATSACGVSVPSTDALLVVDTAAPPLSPLLTAAVSGTTVTLSWTASPGATSYRVEAGTGPLLRNLGVVTVAGTTLTAPNVPPGTYFLRVVAIGPTGESALPDETTVVVR